jgi:hypothetical protein
MLLSAMVLSAALMAAPSHAEPVDHQFEYDGITYTYTETVEDDRTILEGHASPGGRFRLVVENGMVRGYSGVTRVRFSVAEAYEMARGDLLMMASSED